MKEQFMKKRNAVIMAAGTSSRFAPLSYEKPKGLVPVKGEVLIERQINQLREAGIEEVVIVTGYKAEEFEYLKEKMNVILVHNPDYLTRNNNASIKAAEQYIHNTLICSSDNYFPENPFMEQETDSYYAAVYAEGPTNEWCLTEDDDGFITDVKVGGSDTWYMLGHTYWNEEFSRKFLAIMNDIYDLPETADLYWENIYIDHLDELKMKIRKYASDFIFEFDSLDELREFDHVYQQQSGSAILAHVAKQLGCREAELHTFRTIKDTDLAASGFSFVYNDEKYVCRYTDFLPVKE